MAPNRRQRRSERQSASQEASAMRWFQELPEGPCRLALAHLMNQALNDGASAEVALEQGLAHAARLFPEEMVLWGLGSRMGPNPWPDVSVLLLYNSESCAHSSSTWPRKMTCTLRSCNSFVILSSWSSRLCLSSRRCRPSHQRTSCPSRAPGTHLVPRT